ncbi:MAG: DUF4176 domain-containing protein [Coriobacteriales bacterium]|jgi:hypothetical protein
MFTKDDWLPIGSVVMLEDGERPIMVAGYMALDGMSDRYYDYLGFPYPEGRLEDKDYFFDKSMIEEVELVGYYNEDTINFMKFLEDQEEHYLELRAEKEKQGDKED